MVRRARTLWGAKMSSASGRAALEYQLPAAPPVREKKMLTFLTTSMDV